MQNPTSEEFTKAQDRSKAFIAAIPPELAAAEDSLPRKIASLNASAKSKLGHIYRLIDEVSKVRAPFVACREGCASCCRMNVTIFSFEAERIAAATGAQLRKVNESKRHDNGAFAGKPCPFLDDNETCSTYEHRPLVCRRHASFFEDAAPCHPSVMLDISAPEIKFSGLDGAIAQLAQLTGNAVMADIRDFFPDRHR